VPTGTGTLKILLRKMARPPIPSTTGANCRLEDVLSDAPAGRLRAKSAYEKYDRRNQQRAELIDTMIESFTPKWWGGKPERP